MNGIALRPAEPGDWSPLLDLWVQAWTMAMPGIDFDARRSWFSTHLRYLDAAGAVTLLAEGQGGQILGFVTCNPSTHYLDQLAVTPAERGTGLAVTLIEAAKHLSPLCLDLHVNQDNPRALRFYQREGFRIIGEGRNPNSRLMTWHMLWLPPSEADPKLQCDRHL